VGRELQSQSDLATRFSPLQARRDENMYAASFRNMCCWFGFAQKGTVVTQLQLRLVTLAKDARSCKGFNCFGND